MSEVTREIESEAEDTPGLRKGRMTLAACTECRRRKLKVSSRKILGNRSVIGISDVFCFSALGNALSAIAATTSRTLVFTTLRKA